MLESQPCQNDDLVVLSTSYGIFKLDRSALVNNQLVCFRETLIYTNSLLHYVCQYIGPFHVKVKGTVLITPIPCFFFTKMGRSLEFYPLNCFANLCEMLPSKINNTSTPNFSCEFTKRGLAKPTRVYPLAFGGHTIYTRPFSIPLRTSRLKEAPVAYGLCKKPSQLLTELISS